MSADHHYKDQHKYVGSMQGFYFSGRTPLGEELDAHLKHHRQRRRVSVDSGDLDMVVWLEIYRARIRWGELLAQTLVLSLSTALMM